MILTCLPPSYAIKEKTPVVQGQDVPPLDRAQHVLQEKTDHKVIVDRTVFHHKNDLQTCYEWTPVKTGIHAYCIWWRFE